MQCIRDSEASRLLSLNPDPNPNPNPQDNPEGYAKGAVLPYVGGYDDQYSRLLMYHGMADDNVSKGHGIG